MRNSYPKIPYRDGGIPGAEADGSLYEADHFIYRPGKKFALAEMALCVHPIAIERDCRLVFGDGLRVTFLHTQHLAFGEMRKRAAGRCRQDLPDQPFRTCDVGRSRGGHLIEHPTRECDRQPALCLDGSRIERQSTLEQAD